MSLFIIISLFIFSIFLAVLLEEDNNNKSDMKIENKFIQKPNSNINTDNSINNSFKSHLPIVVIDTYGENIKADMLWDDEKKYFVPINDDPYIEGNITLIDNENNINSVKDIPKLESKIKIRLRGNTSINYDKKQYFIKLINDDGSENKQDIFGMGEEYEWILNISYIDKSLIRNYLALSLSSKIMENVPEPRYCEVIIKNKDNLEYKGLYLLMESIKRGDNRLSISKYDNKFTASSYILRRDRLDETGVTLNNYGTINKLTPEYLEVKYPYKKDLTEETLEYITNDIDNFEKALFSSDEKEFYKYSDYIDVESFIDYFIINELFSNYDSGYHSTYIYKEAYGKLKMGPVWDFDSAFDNYKKQQQKIDSTAMHDAPWFKELLKDPEFTRKLIERYNILRKDILSNDNIINYIDEITEYLGPAIDRDWKVWGDFYTSEYLSEYVIDGEIKDRNTKSYDEEINKIKDNIINHGKWLDEDIDSLYQFATFTKDYSIWNELGYFEKTILGNNKETFVKNILAIIYIFIFIASIVYISRE
ncbi:CotH kinase family protein [Clostridium sp. C8]|uniref:CotH kinase family protein n=1 Tax=Clostridium sp. C8 TaxID=1667357 RepID=UPI00155A765C|nr:CotH kinase family protein [Clostridium sp. C8]